MACREVIFIIQTVFDTNAAILNILNGMLYYHKIFYYKMCNNENVITFLLKIINYIFYGVFVNIILV